MNPTQLSQFLDACAALIGPQYLLTETNEMTPFLTDWRKRFHSSALAVARPGDTSEVAALVKLCNRFRVPIVPQGGNTGLVLGSVPNQSAGQKGQALVLSLLRMNAVRALDRHNYTITVEAGCLLANVQQAASESRRLFPLSLGSEGSCSIGGNLATNAGGTAVLRYGNTRELCLGLEVVTADGEIWDGLRGLRKDNTGYDLRDLFIGSEGTLGIITAAVLKLFPQPVAQCTALVALKTVEAAVQLLTMAQHQCGPGLTGFELMSDLCLQLVEQEFPQLHSPFAARHAQYVLLELSDHESQEHAQMLLEQLMQAALEQEVITDAVVASSIGQSEKLWALREHIPLAQAADGKNIKHDIALPISAVAGFITDCGQALSEAFPGSRLVCFGHLGDGNLHFNLAAPKNGDAEAFLQHQEAVNHMVHSRVHYFKGSISAEHGIGVLKRDELPQYKSPIELRLMQQVKRALDPYNLMNPGKIFN
jgi:D-lactate dehydrogenase (cytochrome)